MFNVYAVVGWEIPFNELYCKWDCENTNDFYDCLDSVNYHVQNADGGSLNTNYFFGEDMYLTSVSDNPTIIDEEAFCQWVKDTKHKIMQKGSTSYTGGIYMPLRPRLFMVVE